MHVLQLTWQHWGMQAGTRGGGREGGVHAGGRCVELPVDQDNSNDG